MDKLHSDLLMKIAESTKTPEQTLCAIRRLNKRISQLITPLRLTFFVAKNLQRAPLQPRHGEIVQMVTLELGKKNQAVREIENAGIAFFPPALTSTALEQHMLKQVKQEMKQKVKISRALVSRKRIDPQERELRIAHPPERSVPRSSNSKPNPRPPLPKKVTSPINLEEIQERERRKHGN